MAAKIDYDPSRLLVLDRKRTAARAVIRDLNDQFQELREKRQAAQRRAALSRSKSEHGDPRGRAGHLDQAEKADTEAADLSRQMQETQARMDALSNEANAASAVATSALKFALSQNLPIPSELRARASELQGDVHSGGIDTSGVAKWA